MSNMHSEQFTRQNKLIPTCLGLRHSLYMFENGGHHILDLRTITVHSLSYFKAKDTSLPQELLPNPHIYTNGAPPFQSYLQAAIDVSAHARRIDVSPSMLLSKSSNLGMMQGPNDGMTKSAGFSGDSRFLYGSESNVLEARPGIGDPSVPPFSNVGSNSQALNGNGLGADTSSFGFLGQIPRNFSLSDLTADFTNSSDILEGYSGSAFLATDTNKFLDPQGRAEHQDINGLDNISEGLSYEDFSSG